MKQDNEKKQQITESVKNSINDAIDKFADSFQKRTEDANSFMTINEMEDLISTLNSETRKAYLDMVSEMLSNIDESELIQSKK